LEAKDIKIGDTVRVPNEFTRPGSPRVQATVTKVDPPWVWVRFDYVGKQRSSKHRIEEVSS
jgi:hypothetical protein